MLSFYLKVDKILLEAIQFFMKYLIVKLRRPFTKNGGFTILHVVWLEKFNKCVVLHE